MYATKSVREKLESELAAVSGPVTEKHPGEDIKVLDPDPATPGEQVSKVGNRLFLDASPNAGNFEAVTRISRQSSPYPRSSN